MELADHLSSALQHVVLNGFHRLFDQHKYALSQIEKCTPQALTILSDRSSWPLIKFGAYSANGTKVRPDWLIEFTDAYCQAKGVFDIGIKTRVRHSINKLISTRLIEAHLTGQNGARCTVTQVGESIQPYINA